MECASGSVTEWNGMKCASGSVTKWNEMECASGNGMKRVSQTIHPTIHLY
jgi:hypothetical protein